MFPELLATTARRRVQQAPPAKGPTTTLLAAPHATGSPRHPQQESPALVKETVPAADGLSTPTASPAPTEEEAKDDDAKTPAPSATTESPSPADEEAKDGDAETLAAVKTKPPVDLYQRMIDRGLMHEEVLHKMGLDMYDINLSSIKFDPVLVRKVYRTAYLTANGTPPPARTKPLPVDLVEEANPKSMWLKPCGDVEDGSLPPEFVAGLKVLLQKADVIATTVSGTTAKSSMSATLIDNDRPQNIEILLTTFKLPPTNWRESIVSMTFDSKRLDKLKMVAAAWPSAAESHAVMKYEGDGSDLGVAERFLLELRDVPRVKAKLECIRFSMEFAGRIREWRESVLLTIRGINQLLENKSFLATMQLMFRTVCQLNGDVSDAGELAGKGFHLSAYRQIRRTRSSDSTMSIFELLVYAFQEHNPELGMFVHDLNLLPKSSRVSITGLRSERQALKAGLKALKNEKELAQADLTGDINPNLQDELQRFYCTIESVVTVCDKELKSMKAIWKQQKHACVRLNAFFDEPLETSYNEIIQTVADFVEDYRVQVDKFNKRAPRPEPLPRAHEQEPSDDSVSEQEALELLLSLRQQQSGY